jgi:hypothetical protein
MSTATAPRRTRATSVTSPTSNTRRKEVFVKDSRKVTEPVTETHVALLPLRYAVAPKADGPAYRYQAANLDRGFPALDQTSYVVRELRRGFVYVFAQSKLHAFEVTAGGNLRPYRLAEGGEKILVERAALLFPKRLGAVALAFSEHEWTEQQCQRIVSDTDGARTRSMQRVALASPGPDTFPLAERDTHVENYAGRAAEFAWSDSPASARQASTYARLPTLAEGGQFGIALADPIGITHDLSGLIEQALGDIKAYVSDPDEGNASASTPKQEDSSNAAAKSQSASAMPSLTAPPAPTAEDIAKAEADAAAHTAARARYRKKLVAETIGRLYESCQTSTSDPDTLARLRLEHWRKDPAHKNKPEPSLAELRRDVVAGPAAERLRKHVDEDARRAFLTRYDEGLVELQQHLDAYRTDRLAWLATWNQPGNPHSLHTAWDSFDMDDLLDWLFFELSYARSIVGMGMSHQDKGQAQAKEFALFGKWLQASLDASPLYRSLVGHTPLRQAVEHAPDRSGSTLDGLANVIDDLYRRFPYTFGTEEIVHAMTVFTLNNQWRGAVAENIDALLARIAGNEDAATAVRGLMARYGRFVETTRIELGRYTRYFFEAAGEAPGVNAELSQLTKAGRLRPDGYTAYVAREVTATRTPVAGRGVPNPFGGWGMAGVSAFAGFLYLLNLKMAVTQFDLKDSEQWSNVASAVAAIGSGVNAGLMAFNTATPEAVAALTRRVPVARFLAGRFALRLFGYGGAIFTGITLGFHGAKLHDKGDTDAGLWYAGAALTTTVGGAALTYASGALATAGAEAAGAATTTALLTPVGWLIVGAVLVAGSIVLSLQGDAAQDTPVERWLDASAFGLHTLSDNPAFTALTAEMEALGVALYAPQLMASEWSDRWGFPHYLAEAMVYLPGYDLGESHLSILADGLSTAPVHREFHPAGMVAKLQHYRSKDLPGEQVTFELRYRPSRAVAAPYSLIITVSDATETD